MIISHACARYRAGLGVDSAAEIGHDDGSGREAAK